MPGFHIFQLAPGAEICRVSFCYNLLRIPGFHIFQPVGGVLASVQAVQEYTHNEHQSHGLLLNLHTQKLYTANVEVC